METIEAVFTMLGIFTAAIVFVFPFLVFHFAKKLGCPDEATFEEALDWIIEHDPKDYH